MNQNRKKLAALVSSFFALGVGAPLTSLPAALQVNGALVEPSALQALLAQMNAANTAADGINFQTSAAATITLTSLQNLCQRLTNGGAVTVTLDSAWAIVNSMANPFATQTFPFQIVGNASTTVATPTLTGSGVTLSGTTTVTSGGSRNYQGLITQISTTLGSAVTSGTTFVSIAQIGSTNRYTVTLSGNSISPVVGNAIYLNVTAGTLPAGWYPIDLVSSATSFVVVLPPSGTAWTATAATIPGTATIPTSQYQTGFTGIFSPLLTITGMYGMAAGVIVV
jgi:hypothetical protein